MSLNFKQSIRNIFDTYPSARSSSGKSAKEAQSANFRELAMLIRMSDPVKKRPYIIPYSYHGVARSLSRCPQVHLYDERLWTLQTWIEVWLQFTEDMSSVYLGIGKDGETEVPLSTTFFLPYVSELKKHGFKLTSRLDLKSRKPTGHERSEGGWIAAKKYPANGLPTDTQFNKDLEASLSVCDAVFESQNP
jgi:hypothetical protein